MLKRRIQSTTLSLTDSNLTEQLAARNTFVIDHANVFISLTREVNPYFILYSNNPFEGLTSYYPFIMKALHYFSMLFTVIVISLNASAQSTSWNTGGNTNLNPNCFIGTTDQTPLNIKSGGLTQMKIAPDGSVRLASLTGIGYSYVAVGPNGDLQRLTDPTVDSLFDCSVKLWKADGNYVTPNCFIGSTNQEALRMVTHNTERMRISSTGMVGIGTTTPKSMLQIGDDMPLAVSIHTNGPTDTRYMIGFNTYLDGSTPHFTTNGPGGMINWDANNNDVCIGVTPQGNAGQQANIPTTLAVGENGRVGIGTRDQQELLHVRQSGGAATIRIESGTPLDAPGIEFWSGPFSQTTAHLGSVRGQYNQSTSLGELHFYANGGQTPTGVVEVLKIDKDNAELSSRLGIGTTPNAADQVTVNGAARFTQGDTPSNYLRFHHDGTDAIIEHQTSTANSNALNRLVINPGGNRTDFGGTVVMNANLGLGTDDFLDGGNNKDYRLSVDGRIRAREVKVYSGWADHVFEPGYDLMSLDEVAAFIRENGHLPGVPSAVEVEANGVDVGETQALLLEKVEELTLYMIKLEDENKKMRKEIEALKR